MSTLIATETPKLYVGTYAKYNNGSIAGAWLDLTNYHDADSFLEACADLHKDEADPELMFQDFENFPESFYAESMGASDLEKLYNWLDLDESDREIVSEYAEATGYKLDDISLDDVQDAYITTIEGMNTERELAEYYIDESNVMDIPDHIAPYFDYEAYGRDLMFDHTVSANGFVFTNN